MFVCNKCKKEFLKWQGKCGDCGEWNSVIEVHEELYKGPKNSRNASFNDFYGDLEDVFQESGGEPITCSINEFNRVCKLFRKSVVVIGGEPGIGKSTLMCQLTGSLDGSVLYLSGEEAVSSVKERTKRVCGEITNTKFVNFFFIETLHIILEKTMPAVVVLDSIHTTRSKDNINIKDIVMEITFLSKKYNCCFILVSHITKDGIIAGPKTLEHLVDVVLYLEGDRYGKNRFLRSIKNRFGNTSETGIFEMKENGLIEVPNPSALLISNRRAGIPGSVIFPGVSGSRCLLMEVQALVIESPFPNVEAIGLDPKRVKMIIAILQKWCKLNLNKFEIFINFVGGIKINDPAADLAVAMAILASLKQRSISAEVCFFGELGLTGEVRPVCDIDMRIKESKRLNFKRIYTNSGESKEDDITLITDLVKML
jgi:DNA repair protein RadA/Sms